MSKVIEEEDQVDRAVLVPPSKARERLQSVSRRKTKIDRKARLWAQQNIKIKEPIRPEGYREVPTNGFGEIDFKGATRRAKAKFVRFSDTTPPATIFHLLRKFWRLEKPRLLISVSGGAKSFNLDPRLKQIFQTGLLKVAQTPGAWVVTGGTNTGVMQLVGEALQGSTSACIGISTYGIVTNRQLLLCSENNEDLGGKFPYQVSCSLVEKGAYLDHNHTHHLLVDDGSVGRYGGEIHFRSQLEKHIIEQKVPAVLLILHGGVGTIRTIWSAVSDEFPISVLLVKDSGNAADVFVQALNLLENTDEEYPNSEECYCAILELINKTYPELEEDAKALCIERILFCLTKRECFTVFQMIGEDSVDEAILMALLNGQKTSPLEQLQLTLLWDRAELAKEKVLTRGYTWQQHELDFAMIMSLAMDRVDFVKLLLEYGVSIELLLTKDILEFLYGFQSQTSTSTLNFEFDAREYSCADMDVHGEVISLLCVFEGFDPRRCSIPRVIIQHVIRCLCGNLMNKGTEEFIEDDHSIDWFTFPYRELFFWAVLNNKHKMAIYLWGFEEEAMSKALIAAEINSVLYEHAQKLDLQDDLVKSFASNAREFKDLALKLLDECYKTDEFKTVQLITCESNQFPNTTCLNLAVDINDRDYVSHNSVQFLLNEVWTGFIRMREVTDWKLFCAYVVPPLIDGLAFYSESAMKSKAYFNEDDEDAVMATSFMDKSYQNGMDSTFRFMDESSLKLIPPESKYGNYESVSYERRKKMKETPMPFYYKFFLFYFKTPVIKFFAHVLSYFVFLFLFAYVCMLKKGEVLSIPEYLLIVYVVSLAVAELYQITQSDSHSVKLKIKEWLSSPWNRLDAMAIIFYFIALGLRVHEETRDIGHLMFAIDGGFWVVRLLHVFCVHRILGPYVVMMYRMTQDLLYFMVILLVFLFSYGVTCKAILEPQPPQSVMAMMKHIIFHPYFNIYGELFIDRDPIDNATTRFGTPVINSYAEPVAWVLLGVYLLITNVLLMNILIAIFNNTFNDVQENAAQIWKYERHAIVIEYAQRAPLAAPFNLIVHLFLLIRWVCQQCGICARNDDAKSCGLKSDVTDEVKEELLEFENKCLSKFIRKRELMLTRPIEELSVDILGQVEHIHTTIDSFDDRLKEMESQIKTFSAT